MRYAHCSICGRDYNDSEMRPNMFGSLHIPFTYCEYCAQLTESFPDEKLANGLTRREHWQMCLLDAVIQSLGDLWDAFQAHLAQCSGKE